MNIASVFDWFARESLHAADQTNDLRQREMFLRLALLWTAAAQRSCEEVATQSTVPGTGGNERTVVIIMPGACGLLASLVD
jgi:hypothetical protein